MRSTRTLGFAALLLGSTLLGVVGARAAPSSPLWIDDTSGVIGTLDVGTGAVTVIGDTGLGASLTDLAFQDGNLYGTTFTGLYSISQTNGAATLISTYTAVSGMNALVGSSGTALYGASTNDSNLYAVTTAGVATVIGSPGPFSAGDLAFNGAFLYESAVDGATGNDELLQLTLSGGLLTNTTVIGDFSAGGSPLTAVYGLATGDDGVTYAVDGTGIYTVDLATADLTLIEDYGGRGLGPANGSAFITESPPPPVPEPASLALLATALAGLGLLRGRRQA